MSIPMTVEDFILMGERLNSEDVVKEIDRIVPIAKADITKLATLDYTAANLEQLQGYRATLTSNTAGRRDRIGAKKSARTTEAVAVRTGKLVLRSGIAMAINATANRSVPAGESPDTTREIVERITTQINAVTGRIGRDSVALRTRLVSIKSILALPEIAPQGDAAVRARTDFLARIDQATAQLPGLAEAKKTLQADARSDTAGLDEIDGRAYFNMKCLTLAGRAYFNEHGDYVRAAEYQLTGLHAATSKKQKPEGNPQP